MRMRMRFLLPPCLALAISPACSGCVIGFGEPEKRGSVVDGLEVETDLTLRALDGADTAAALPALAALGKNAEQADELPLRIQTAILTARTLAAEAALHPPKQAAELRQAAFRHAAAALREASDWRRFDPGAQEAILLLYDARILHASLAPGTDVAGELPSLLAAAAAEARMQNDPARAAAWQLALFEEQLQNSAYSAARASLAAAKASFAEIPSGESEPLRPALVEAEADLALRENRAREAEKLYNEALAAARALRRRPDLHRILLKLSAAATRSGDPDSAERAAWYRRRADGVSQSAARAEAQGSAQ